MAVGTGYGTLGMVSTDQLNRAFMELPVSVSSRPAMLKKEIEQLRQELAEKEAELKALEVPVSRLDQRPIARTFTIDSLRSDRNDAHDRLHSHMTVLKRKIAVAAPACASCAQAEVRFDLSVDHVHAQENIALTARCTSKIGCVYASESRVPDHAIMAAESPSYISSDRPTTEVQDSW